MAAIAAHVRTLEADIRSVGPRASEREHIGQRDSGPDSRARRSGAPRRLTRDLADPDQSCTAIAGTLQGGGDLTFAKRLAQRSQGQAQLALDLSVDPQSPPIGVEFRDLAVTAYVERIRRGHGPLAQRTQASLGVERLVLMHDQVIAFSVATHGPSLGPPNAPAGRPVPVCRSDPVALCKTGQLRGEPV
jgi:hypothetical protein